ncbi:MAG: DUF2281 domain-containing protein [Cytophagales bacterium]|nr:DUF2281 domain-containing protein [Cytophagales bacterium]
MKQEKNGTSHEPGRKKLRLINKVLQLKREDTVDHIHSFIKKDQENGNAPESINLQKFGGGKDIILRIADDFDAPLEVFKDYQP